MSPASLASGIDVESLLISFPSTPSPSPFHVRMYTQPTELVGEFIEETFVTGEFFFCKISYVAILPTHCCSVAVRAPFVPDQSAAYHL